MPSEEKRFSMVGWLSSAARMPRPGATSVRAVDSSGVVIICTSLWLAGSAAVPVRDGAPEAIARIRDVSSLEGSDRFAELTVAEHVLDPAPEVSALQVARHDIRRQLRQRGEKVANGASPAQGPAGPREHEFFVSTHRNVGVLLAVTHVGGQARGNAEPLGRVARFDGTGQEHRLVDGEIGEERQ